MRLTRVVRTCMACPAQWDAWTDGGQYLYLRYRHGIGSVTPYPTADWEQWDVDTQPTTEWDDGTGSGTLALSDFLTAASLELTPDAQVIGD